MSIRSHRKNYKPFKYPKAYELMKLQQRADWLPEEIGDMTRDLSNFRSDFTKAEQHGITTVLRVFTNVEISGAECYWIGRVWKEFPHPEIRGMATTNAAMEHKHAEAYGRLNTDLGLDTEEFYLSFLSDPSYVQRNKEIEDALNDKRTIKSLAVFSLVEGVALFGQFAYLQSFVRQGVLTQLDNLIEWSSRDEGGIHLLGTVFLFLELIKEGEVFKEEEWKELCIKFYEQEKVIVNEMFRYGAPRGITQEELLGFIQHRINYVSNLLGFSEVLSGYNKTVEGWFYKGQNLFVSRDFFASRVTEYSKGYNFSDVWEDKDEL